MKPRSLAILAMLLIALCSMPALALRANLGTDFQQLEALGRYEDLLFLRRSTMDMVLAVHVAWSGVPYDRDMDKFVFETRVDRRYWNFVNGQKREITALLDKAKLTPAQLRHLDDRVRVYVEDHLSPEFDEMGNFYIGRKAAVFEAAGMFTDAAHRRRLLGYYCQRVCVPYYATMAEELKRQGRDREAAAYRAKSEEYERRAMIEFRRANGNRLLAQQPGGGGRQPQKPAAAMALLRQGMGHASPDARLAAGLALAEQGQAVAADDRDPEVKLLFQSAAQPAGSPPGLKPGLLAAYYSDPAQTSPAATRVLPRAELGFIGDERFPQKLRPLWQKPGVFPPNATGQFLVKWRGKLQVPADGNYRFYIKTSGENRAIVRISQETVISPKSDRQLMYSLQRNYKGGTISRVDFSSTTALKQGLVDIEIDFRGGEVREQFGTASMRLMWSGDDFVMTPVPAGALFCEDGK